MPLVKKKLSVAAGATSATAKCACWQVTARNAGLTVEAQYKKVVSSPDLQDLLVCVLAGTAWHGDTERIVT